MKFAHRSGTININLQKIIAEGAFSYNSIRRILQTLSVESFSEKELHRKIIQRFGEDIKVLIRISYAWKEDHGVVAFRKKYKGLFLGDGSFARVTIRGLTKAPLEF